MERYKTRPDVVLTEVCGEYLLVAAKPVRNLCPYVTGINESSAFLWQRLKTGADLTELKAAVMEEYEVEEPEMLDNMIRDFLDEMLKMHYLVVEGEEDNE